MKTRRSLGGASAGDKALPHRSIRSRELGLDTRGAKSNRNAFPFRNSKSAFRNSPDV
jgi:hypothetical protein